MSEFGGHPFLDPNRPHSYDGPQPPVFANPNDFALEHEWFGVNDAIERDMRVQSYGSTPSVVDNQYEAQTTEGDEDEELAELVRRVGKPIVKLVKLAHKLDERRGLGSWKYASDAFDALLGLNEHEIRANRALLIEFSAWWSMGLIIEVMEGRGISDMGAYSAWSELADSIEKKQEEYLAIDDWTIRNDTQLAATRTTLNIYRT